MVVPLWAPAEATARTVAETKSILIREVIRTVDNTQIQSIRALATDRGLSDVGGGAVVEDGCDGKAEMAFLVVGEVEGAGAVGLRFVRWDSVKGG